jgi:hypothetical protein
MIALRIEKLGFIIFGIYGYGTTPDQAEKYS